MAQQQEDRAFRWLQKPRWNSHPSGHKQLGEGPAERCSPAPAQTDSVRGGQNALRKLAWPSPATAEKDPEREALEPAHSSPTLANSTRPRPGAARGHCCPEHNWDDPAQT